MSNKKQKQGNSLPVLQPDAAGIDIGAEEIFVAVPAGSSPGAGPSFPHIHEEFAGNG
jgi:hypothetical protein